MHVTPVYFGRRTVPPGRLTLQHRAPQTLQIISSRMFCDTGVEQFPRFRDFPTQTFTLRIRVWFKASLIYPRFD